MKTKAILLLFAFSLVSAGSAYGQGQGHHYGRGHGRGNPHTDKQHTDKQGPHDNGDGDDDEGDEDDDGDFDEAALQARIHDVVQSLSLGTLTTRDGASIPITAQSKLYVVMTGRIVATSNPPASSSLVSTATGGAVSIAETAPSAARFIESFAGAGPNAQESLRTLTLNLAALTLQPRRLPVVVKEFNELVQAAPASFLSDPPPEFVALHAVLEKVSAGLPKR